MKFGQFIEYNKSNIFLQKSYRKWDGETSSRSLFVFQEVYSLVSRYFDIPQISKQWKQTSYKFRLLIERYIQFWFFRKGSGNSFFTTFCVWFSKKTMFLMLYSINWPNFIAWLPSLTEILGNMCIAILC